MRLPEGIRRVTFPLPLGIDHVHCYLLRGDGGWTIVDAGLGLPAVVARWRDVVRELDAPVERIVVTHLHPDHVGASRDVADLTGARVYQGRIDRAQCVVVWGADRPVARWEEHLRSHGTPEAVVERITADSAALLPLVHIVEEVALLDEGDLLGDWRVVHLPGHADGHIALWREGDGVLVAGDAILAGITPTVGLWPGGRPDPLADFEASLRRVIELEPRLALAGHEQAIADPVARASEILAHHDERLERTVEALSDGVRSAYDVSLELFPDAPPAQRRFAIAEALSHLEHLVSAGVVARTDGGYHRA